jgi:hypothetical protein
MIIAVQNVPTKNSLQTRSSGKASVGVMIFPTQMLQFDTVCYAIILSLGWKNVKSGHPMRVWYLGGSEPL